METKQQVRVGIVEVYSELGSTTTQTSDQFVIWTWREDGPETAVRGGNMNDWV